MKNVLLIGPGAVGSLCGAGLLKADTLDFRVLADDERIQRYRRTGHYLNGTLLPYCYQTVEDLRNWCPDLILIATKSNGLRQLPELMRLCVAKRHTVILPLLNGISSPFFLKKLFPENPVLQGFFLGHASYREENRITHDGVGKFYLGCMEENGEDKEFLSKCAEVFRKASIPVEVPENMLNALWHKYVLNVGVNQSSAYFMADYGTLQKTPAYLQFARDLMEEAVAVAAKLDIPGREDMVQRAMDVILSMPPTAKTSMLQDVEKGRPTEVDLFAGTLIKLGRKCNIPTPCNEKIWDKFSSSLS